MPTKKSRVYAFIDSQNLHLSVKNSLRGKNGRVYYSGWKLDFAKFFVYLKDKYGVAKAFIFIGYVAGNEALYTKLQEAGYLLIFKPTLEYKKANKLIIKGNVDAELVLHTMIKYTKYQKAIIVAGDGDYHCLIEYLTSKNKLLYVMIPNRYNYSSLLRKFRRNFVYITDLKGKLEDK